MTDSDAFLAKDFIETAEGLIFAVVAHGAEQAKVLSFLRYVHNGRAWQKLATDAANAYLQQHHARYLHYAQDLDAHLHAVPVAEIAKHHKPQQRLQEILSTSQPDPVQQDLLDLCALFKAHGLDLQKLGITGSLLVNAQQAGSDLDLVCYGRDIFQRCRAIARDLIHLGHLQALSELDWLDAYERRDCALSYDDYVWHEQRKFNKAIINGRKFDLNFIDLSMSAAAKRYQKQGRITLQCTVIQDEFGFDYPAQFSIDHPQITGIVCFTATYTGQVFCGERVEVAGMLEVSA
ncbi:MAG: hypothetical protein ABL925_18275, partial [Methylococcales bacterium]